MALRVLLADESPTIKKAIQLALQDFAVDVRSVNIGLDVLNVAKTFQPDIIFTDVLLQKRNGYEVATDLKQDTATSNIPIVLMWSGFMSLDTTKFQQSGANSKIEKPFDVNTLRSLVKKLVPKTQSQSLSSYLQFPKMPEFKEQAPINENPATPVAEVTMQKPTIPAEPQNSQINNPSNLSAPPPLPEDSHIQFDSEASGDSSNWGMESFTSIDEFKEEQTSTFQEIPLNPSSNTSHFDDDEDDEDSPWVQKNISSLKVDPENFAGSPEEFHFSESTSSLDRNELDPELSAIKGPELQVEEILAPEPFDEAPDESFPQFKRQPAAMSKQEIEQYLEEVLGKTLQEVLQDMVPRIAKEIIKEEIKRLTKNK